MRIKETSAVRSRILSKLISAKNCVEYFDRAYYGFYVPSSGMLFNSPYGGKLNLLWNLVYVQIRSMWLWIRVCCLHITRRFYPMTSVHPVSVLILHPRLERNKLCGHGLWDRQKPYSFQYKEVAFLFFPQNLSLKFVIIHFLTSVAYCSCSTTCTLYK